jgi:hypothetical protein
MFELSRFQASRESEDLFKNKIQTRLKKHNAIEVQNIIEEQS